MVFMIDVLSLSIRELLTNNIVRQDDISELCTRGALFFYLKNKASSVPLFSRSEAKKVTPEQNFIALTLLYPNQKSHQQK